MTGAPVDEERIRQYLARDYPRLVAGLAIVCGSRALAEDAVQEALARAWERAIRGERIEALSAWVGTVALNITRSHFRRFLAERRAGDRLHHSTRHPESVEGGDDAETRLDLIRAITLLPRRQREVIVLRYFAAADIREIAIGLGTNVGAVKALLFRARRALAAALGEPEEGELEHGAPR